MFPFKSTLLIDPSLKPINRYYPQDEYSRAEIDRDSNKTLCVFDQRFIKSTHPYSEYTTNSKVVIGEKAPKTPPLTPFAFDHFFDFAGNVNIV